VIDEEKDEKQNRYVEPMEGQTFFSLAEAYGEDKPLDDNGRVTIIEPIKDEKSKFN